MSYDISVTLVIVEANKDDRLKVFIYDHVTRKLLAEIAEVRAYSPGVIHVLGRIENLPDKRHVSVFVKCTNPNAVVLPGMIKYKKT